MTRDDAPAVGGYFGTAITLVLVLLAGLGRIGVCPDDSPLIVSFPYSVAIGSSSGVAQLIGVVVGIVQWPIYGFVAGSVIREREPLSLTYASSLLLIVCHFAMVAYLGR